MNTWKGIKELEVNARRGCVTPCSRWNHTFRSSNRKYWILLIAPLINKLLNSKHINPPQLDFPLIYTVISWCVLSQRIASFCILYLQTGFCWLVELRWWTWAPPPWPSPCSPAWIRSRERRLWQKYLELAACRTQTDAYGCSSWCSEVVWGDNKNGKIREVDLIEAHFIRRCLLVWGCVRVEGGTSKQYS